MDTLRQCQSKYTVLECAIIRQAWLLITSPWCCVRCARGDKMKTIIFTETSLDTNFLSVLGQKTYQREFSTYKGRCMRFTSKRTLQQEWNIACIVTLCQQQKVIWSWPERLNFEFTDFITTKRQDLKIFVMSDFIQVQSSVKPLIINTGYSNNQ